MVRASTSGAYDFERFDPADDWCWKKLRWTLDDLEAQNDVQVLEAQHRHWVTVFSNSALAEESFDSAKDNATSLLQQLLCARVPWDTERFQQSAGGTVEDAITVFRDTYGYPGDPQYEQMLADMVATFDKLEKGVVDGTIPTTTV